MGKLLLAMVMIAAVTVSCMDTVQTSREEYMMGETKEEAVRERGEKRREAIEENGDVFEHEEWREWDNEWIDEYSEKFGAAAAADIKPLDIDAPRQ